MRLAGTATIMVVIDSLRSDQHSSTGHLLGIGHDHRKADVKNGSDRGCVLSSTQICSLSTRMSEAIDRRRKCNEATMGVASDIHALVFHAYR